MFEGSRAFDIGWGLVTGTACFALGIAALVLWIRARRTGGTSVFGAAADPGRGLQLAWSILAMSMGGTNYGCRFIDHNYLAAVHEGFFALTLLVFALFAPPVLRTLRSGAARRAAA